MRTIALVAAVLSLAAAPQTPPSPAALAARVQARYATVRDFTADFTLTQTGGLALRAAVDRGKVSIRKPSRMHWIFLTGNKSEVVSDGTKIYSYFPQDRYVQIADVPADGPPSSALMLLGGRGDLVGDFTSTMPTDQPTGEWRLTLTPRTKTADFSTLTLIVDRTTLQLHGFEVVDAGDGGSSSASARAVQTFRFTNLRENQGVADSVFDFRIPKGVEIR